MFVIFVETYKDLPEEEIDLARSAIGTDVTRISIGCADVALDFINFCEEQTSIARVVNTEVSVEEAMNAAASRDADELARSAVLMESFYRDQQSKSMW